MSPHHSDQMSERAEGLCWIGDRKYSSGGSARDAYASKNTSTHTVHHHALEIDQ